MISDPRDPFDDDLDEADEEDLWFLPGPSDDEDLDPTAPPLPTANRSQLISVSEWAEAQAFLAAPLARLAARMGALGERLRRAPDGWHHRLAFQEASELSWHTGSRVHAEKLAMWLGLHTGWFEDDDRAMARAGWAARRLATGRMPELSDIDGLMHFLSRTDVSEDDLDGLRDQLTNWSEVVETARELHPVTWAAFGYHLWPIAGLNEGRPSEFDAAVICARLATGGLAGGAVFMPLVTAGGGALRRGGTADDRLRNWIKGADQATLNSLRFLERLENWSISAVDALSDKSGRTPQMLAEVFVSWPLVSAPLAEAKTGQSRAAIQRNLILFEAQGLIREVTGQGRYRVWTARL